MRDVSIQLGDYVEGGIYYGIKKGCNEAFVIDALTRERLLAEDEKSAEVIRPFLAGRDIKRYQEPFLDNYILFIPWHFPLHKDTSIEGASHTAELAFQEKYPAIYNHLLKYTLQLSNRNKAETGIRYEWYALQRCAASYYNEFDQIKIVYPDIALTSKFTIESNGSYTNDTGLIMPKEDQFLLGVLHSKLKWQVLSQLCPVLGDINKGGLLSLKNIYLKQLPIATADEETKASITPLVEQVLSIKQADAAADTSGLEAEIDVLVYRLYNFTYEEVLLVDPAFALSEAAYSQPEVSYN